MAIKFRCPQCNKAFSVKDEYVGKKGKCPCGAKITVPEVSSLSKPSSVEAHEHKVIPEPKKELSKQESKPIGEKSSPVSSVPTVEVAPTGTPAGICPEKPGTKKPDKPGKIPPRLFWLAILCPPIALFITGNICTALGFTVLLIGTFGAAWVALAPLTILIVRNTMQTVDSMTPQIEEMKRGESKLCPKCTKAIKIETLICKHCGHKLTEADDIGSLRIKAMLIYSDAKVYHNTNFNIAGELTVVKQRIQQVFQRSNTRVLEVAPNQIDFEHGSGQKTRKQGILQSSPELLPKRGTIILEFVANKTNLTVNISENMGSELLDFKSKRKFKDSLKAWVQEFRSALEANHSE